MSKTFFMTMGFFFCLSAFITLGGRYHFLVGFQSSEQKIHHINQEIEDLKEKKRGYESQALYHEDQAERLQFDDQRVLETRRHIQIAAAKRGAAEKIQEKINQLEAQKSMLLKEHAAAV